MRRNLVFVRAGKNSLHREAIAGDPQRNWDCAVSWYTEPPNETIAEHYSAGGVNKFDAFVQVYAGNLSDRGYLHVLLLDDDVRFRPGDISRLFEICEREALQLCQPSLAWGTNANHLVTVRNPACIVRQVRFVEVMVPCFSRSTLEELLPTFSLTRSTWGIDWAWASLLDGQKRITVVDAIQVLHTKPVNLQEGPFYFYMRSLGVEPSVELQAMQRKFPLPGAVTTLDAGHKYFLPLPRELNRQLMWLIERFKPPLHLAARALARLHSRLKPQSSRSHAG